MGEYKVYARRIGELLEKEKALVQQINKLKGKRKLRPKDQLALEEAEEQLGRVREEAKEICSMLDDYREKEGQKVIQQAFFDEEAQIYNEVIGICYRKAILWRDDGLLFWFDCDEADGVAIGDSELDDGLLFPFSDLPAGERKMILSYLIEAGSTPVHYLEFLEEEMKK